MLHAHLQHHNDTIIKQTQKDKDAGRNDAWRKTQEDFFNNILPLTLLQGFERVVQGLHVRGSWRSNINCNILTPLLWPSRCVFLVLLMLGSTPSGFPRPPLGRVWLSLPHLVSSCLELSCNYFLDSNSTELNNNSTPPHDRPLDLWNRMFNRHQAEITVRQFRGHSLPVHQSVLAQWDLHLVPYYKP